MPNFLWRVQVRSVAPRCPNAHPRLYEVPPQAANLVDGRVSSGLLKIHNYEVPARLIGQDAAEAIRCTRVAARSRSPRRG
jgi:hypothetical protein